MFVLPRTVLFDASHIQLNCIINNSTNPIETNYFTELFKGFRSSWYALGFFNESSYICSYEDVVIEFFVNVISCNVLHFNVTFSSTQQDGTVVELFEIFMKLLKHNNVHVES